ncbi:MAG: glycine dehydrogenase, partial [Candidatus Marinimicrobia bacterium]|nr:glycine dehydrogenase [Candidatus Neomarinimicrobiota bacterium]
MRYLPHTDVDVQQMLDQIGVSNIEELFSGVPADCRLKRPLDLSAAKSESETLTFLRGLAEQNTKTSDWDSFLGGGAYNHFIPAVIDQLVSRSEFYTAYTPYQPEISQGTLQAVFEFQTLICQLTGMDVANASMYDGASACAEAVLLTIRAGKKRHKILLSQGLPPQYRETIATYSAHLNIDLIDIPLQAGVTDQAELQKLLSDPVAAV